MNLDIFSHIPTHDHPAVYSKELVDTFIKEIRKRTFVVDPFAGTGRIHAIAEAARVRLSVGVELEPEWANVDMFPRFPRWQIVGDSIKVVPTLPWYDTVLVSPCYGNRMADHHEARDSSRRNTYKHRLGRKLTINNAGAMYFGPAYRDLHWKVWKVTVAGLSPGGKFVLNIKNHYKKGVEIDVTKFHDDALHLLGLKRERWHKVPCRSNRHGANGQLRAEYESILVYRKRSLT